MIRRLNKKAEIGATMTWIIAFLIIFFVMLLFIGMSGFLAGKKVLTDSNEISLQEEKSNLEASRRLMSLLNYEVEIDGEKLSFIQGIYNYIEEVEQKDLDRNNLRPNTEAKLLIEEIRGFLKDDCFEYVLELPFKVIFRLKGKGNRGFKDDKESLVSEVKDIVNSGVWENGVPTQEVVFPIYHNDKRTEIKFYFRSVC